MTTRDNKLVDAADARVTLAEIPFLRLREGLPNRLIDGSASLGDSVDAAQRALAPPDLVIDLGGGRIRAGGEAVSMPPASLAFYAMMARRRVAGQEPVRWSTDGLEREFLDLYQRITGDMSADLERVEEALEDGMTQEYSATTWCTSYRLPSVAWVLASRPGRRSWVARCGPVTPAGKPVGCAKRTTPGRHPAVGRVSQA